MEQTPGIEVDFRHTHANHAVVVGITICAFFLLVSSVAAASFQITPTAGSYNTGQIFTTIISIDTEGTIINAAEGVLEFDARYLIVESISTNISIFKFWVEEPTFSNAAGTISFSGGLPSPGYNGANGKVLAITFQANSAGKSLLKLVSGAILANDGFGTNILSSTQEAEYRISITTVSPRTKPQKEAIIPFEPLGEALVTTTTTISLTDLPVIISYSKIFTPSKNPLVVGGIALPNITVIGLLRGIDDMYSFETLSDSYGAWSVTFGEKIPAGVYALTFQARDENGALSLETEPVIIKRIRDKTPFIVSIVAIILIIAALYIKRQGHWKKYYPTIKKRLRKIIHRIEKKI